MTILSRRDGELLGYVDENGIEWGNLEEGDAYLNDKNERVVATLCDKNGDYITRVLTRDKPPRLWKNPRYFISEGFEMVFNGNGKIEIIPLKGN